MKCVLSFQWAFLFIFGNEIGKAIFYALAVLRFSVFSQQLFIGCAQKRREANFTNVSQCLFVGFYLRDCSAFDSIFCSSFLHRCFASISTAHFHARSCKICCLPRSSGFCLTFGHTASKMGADLMLNFALWMIVPGTVTSVLQNLYYSIFCRHRKGLVPKQATERFQVHYNNIYCLVIGAYLAYCIANTIYTNLNSNFYSQFGMTRRTFDPRELRTKFRILSLRLHPDKNPSAEASLEFDRVKKIYEILSVKEKRQVYDKFGDFTCNGCVGLRDHLYAYLPGMVGFYGMSALVMLIMHVAGKRDYAQSLRYLFILLFASCELFLLTRDVDPLDAVWMINSFTIGEKITILRECSVYFFLFLSQLGPILLPERSEGKALKAEIQRISALAEAVEHETKAHVLSSLEPFQELPEAMDRLKKQMEKAAVDMRLFETDEQYRERYLQALQRRR